MFKEASFNMFVWVEMIKREKIFGKINVGPTLIHPKEKECLED